MKNYVDFFPQTPEGFHLRVEETLISLEENEMKNVSVFSRRMAAAIAAILILVMAATAVAVVQGNELRSSLNEAGGEGLAMQVQDVHVSDSRNEFSFTIDEILWEEGKLFASYTVSVPEDGNVYLFSPVDVQLNGLDLGYQGGIDAEYFALLYALGGEYGATTTRIMQIEIPEYMETAEDNRFSCGCVFMQALKPLKQLEQEEYDALFAEANANEQSRNTDALYYFVDAAASENDVPMVYLHTYPEVRAAMDENDVISPEALEETGIAKKADVRAISIPIQKSESDGIRFNDAEQHIYQMDGYSIEITKLDISRFHAGYEAIIRKDGGEMGEWTSSEPYGQFYMLCDADGGDIGLGAGWSLGGGMLSVDANGEKVYHIDQDSEILCDVENLTEVWLAPEIYDENGEYAGCDMSRAIKLTPIYNPDLMEAMPEPDPADSDDLSS